MSVFTSMFKQDMDYILKKQKFIYILITVLILAMSACQLTNFSALIKYNENNTKYYYFDFTLNSTENLSTTLENFCEENKGTIDLIDVALPYTENYAGASMVSTLLARYYYDNIDNSVLRGTWFTNQEFNEGKKLIVVSYRDLNNTFGYSHHMNSIIDIDGMEYTVIGEKTGYAVIPYSSYTTENMQVKYIQVKFKEEFDISVFQAKNIIEKHFDVKNYVHFNYDNQSSLSMNSVLYSYLLFVAMAVFSIPLIAYLVGKFKKQTEILKNYGMKHMKFVGVSVLIFMPAFIAGYILSVPVYLIITKLFTSAELFAPVPLMIIIINYFIELIIFSLISIMAMETGFLKLPAKNNKKEAKNV